jgi:hypothetical protein
MNQDSTHAMTEVELNAVDLVGLAPTDSRGAQAAYAPLPQTSFDEEIAALGMPIPSDMPECVLPKQGRGLMGHRALGLLGVVLITSAAFVSHQVATHTPASEPATTIAWTPLPEAGDIAMDEPEEEPAVEPTLFANPFDPTEVFELAPGLSQDEAREQVAQILLERARERMASR